MGFHLHFLNGRTHNWMLGDLSPYSDDDSSDLFGELMKTTALASSLKLVP